MPKKRTLKDELSLSSRIWLKSPPEWSDFCILWMAFNAIYRGQPDSKERARVVSAIRNGISKHKAKVILQAVEHAINRIVQLPPGNMIMDEWDPKFRAASRKYKRIYGNKSEDPVSRLAAVAAILYQVRCNLIHGSKDPTNARDRMLIKESMRVLRAIMEAFLDRDATN